METNDINQENIVEKEIKSPIHLGFMITSIVLFVIGMIAYCIFAFAIADLEGAEAFAIIILIIFLFAADIAYVLSFIFGLVGFIRTLVDRKHFRMNKVSLVIFSILLALNVGMLIFANTSIPAIIGSLA